MTGYEENLDVSTVATGSFDAELSDDGESIHYVLSYSGLEGTVQQAHVHFGKPAINGGVSFFLCGTGPGPANRPPRLLRPRLTARSPARSRTTSWRRT